MGDPAGIGPEIALKAMIARRRNRGCRLACIGDLAVLRQAASRTGIRPDFFSVNDPDDSAPGAVNVLDMQQIRTGDFTIGTLSARCGRAAYAYIKKAIALALQGKAAGVVTCPINKEALRMASIRYPGHTEIFADETGAGDVSMLFYLDGVGVAHVTTHCSLRKAISLIAKPRVLSHVRLLDKAMRRLGVGKPRIAVGGLNPHAGEHGLFGNEERLHIEPAIRQAQAAGIDARGPFPPDTVFMRAFKGEFDGVVSMLHDHGFVALKSRDFDHGVNITIGLPIIRTSVGHGTAFDRAGTGTASPASLLAAIDAARLLYKNRNL